MKKEYVVVRNTRVPRLYDVVEVDYAKESVQYVDTQLSFTDAATKVEELNEKSQQTQVTL